jgi:hypothetical protein
MKWEYRALKIEPKGLLGGIVDAGEFERALNELGNQGWELVTAFDTNLSHGASREVIAVLKRPRQ